MASQRKRQHRVRHEIGDLNKENPRLSNEQTKIVSPTTIVKERNNYLVKNDNRSNNSFKKEIGKGNENSNVNFAESKEYEPVTYMESKTKQQTTNPFKNRPIEDRIPTKQREIVSNWHKFDSFAAEEEIDLGEDYLMGEDFSEILELSEISGIKDGYLHLKGEKSWGEVDGSHHGLGSIKVSDLTAAFATIPFHKQLKIPEDMLPVSFVTQYDKIAEEKRKNYNGTTTDSAMDIQQKIINALTFEDHSPTIPEDTEDAVHPRLNALQTMMPTKSMTNLGTLESTKVVSDQKPVGSLNFDFSICKNKNSLDKNIPKNEIKNAKSESSEVKIDLIKNSNQEADLKSTAKFNVPAIDKTQSSKQVPFKNKNSIVEPKIDKELEDWLDSVIGD